MMNFPCLFKQYYTASDIMKNPDEPVTMGVMQGPGFVNNQLEIKLIINITVKQLSIY